MALSLTTPNTLIGALAPKSTLGRASAQFAAVLLGTLLLTISAKINVPVWPVPVTLQSFAVAAIAAAFGARMAVATVALYLAQGAMGLPVFATGGGFAYLVGPTGGFLLAFVLMAYIVGRAADLGATRRPLALFGAMLAGNLVMFACGFAWLLTLSGQAGWIDPANPLASAFAGAVQPFLVWDALKMALAALSVTGLMHLIGRRA